MNQEQKKLIQQILASQNNQLQVDAIKMVEQEKNGVPDKERTIKIVKEHLVTVNKNKFPQLEIKQRAERRKYTQSFRNTLEGEKREQKEKREEEQHKQEIERIKQQKKIDKVMKAYGAQQITLGNYSPSFIERLQRAYEKWKHTLENQKKVLEKEQKSHQSFMQNLQRQATIETQNTSVIQTQRKTQQPNKEKEEERE